MFHCELDSFVLKFKYLWRAGRNAKLSIKSNGGKAEAHLSVELGDAPAVANQVNQRRNGPAQQRRRERRAAAREGDKVAEEANVQPTTAEEAVENVADAENFVAEKANNSEEEGNIDIISDEMCSDRSYLEKDDDKETFVENLVFTTSSKESLEDQDIENLLDYTLKIVGIEILKVKVNRNEEGSLASCSVLSL